MFCWAVSGPRGSMPGFGAGLVRFLARLLSVVAFLAFFAMFTTFLFGSGQVLILHDKSLKAMPQFTGLLIFSLPPNFLHREVNFLNIIMRCGHANLKIFH
jgi:hypothetical protein